MAYQELPKGLKYELKALGIINDATKFIFLTEMSVNNSKNINKKTNKKSFINKLNKLIWNLF